MRFWGGLVVAAAFVALPWVLTGPFYERMGFTYTGEVEEGERVMRRPL